MNNGMKPSALSDYSIAIPIPVQWGDQDAIGHVNNTVPIRWMESARIAYFDQAGLRDLMTNKSVGIILASVTCHYREQINFPDTVTVGARITRLGNSSITMEHAIHSQQAERIAAEGTSVVVVFDYENNQPTRIPDKIRQTVERLEGRQLSVGTDPNSS